MGLKMISKLLIITLCIFSSSSIAKQQTTVGCFSADKINLKFTEILHNNVLSGYVVYKGRSKLIPLVFIKKEEVNFDDRPSEFIYTWNEILDGKVNGSYVIASQGARFNSFHYTSKTGKTIEFKEKIEAYNSEGSNCAW